MRKQGVVFMFIVAAVLAGIDTAAAAEARVIEQPATYKGRIIDFAGDWEGASACVVLRTDDIRCFASEAEQWRELAKLRRPSPATATLDLDVYCLDRTDLYVILYENTSFGGNSVSYNVANVWHDLSATMDNVTSSWRNNTYCDATAATGTGGGGSTLTLAARSSNSDVGSTWNDVISSVRINA